MAQDLIKKKQEINPDLAKFLVDVASAAYIDEKKLSDKDFNKSMLNELGTALLKKNTTKNVRLRHVFTTKRVAWNNDNATDDLGKEEVYIGFLGAGTWAKLKKDYVLVAFRGSKQEYGDWFRGGNFSYTAAENPIVGKGTIHNGFHNFFKNFAEDAARETFKLLVQLFQRDDTLPLLFITGHSLGAALATLTSLYLKEKWQEYVNNIEDNNTKISLIKRKKQVQPIIYTFGSPRVGNREFAQYFNKSIGYYDNSLKTNSSIRFNAKADIVPAFPKARSFHVDQGIFLTPWDVGKLQGSLPHANPLKNHAIENYSQLIRKYIAQHKSWNFDASEANSLAVMNSYQEDMVGGLSQIAPSVHQSLSNSPMILDGGQIIFDRTVSTQSVVLRTKSEHSSL